MFTVKRYVLLNSLFGCLINNVVHHKRAAVQTVLDDAGRAIQGRFQCKLVIWYSAFLLLLYVWCSSVVHQVRVALTARDY